VTTSSFGAQSRRPSGVPRGSVSPSLAFALGLLCASIPWAMVAANSLEHQRSAVEVLRASTQELESVAALAARKAADIRHGFNVK
jgi:hypothetical protein